MHLLAAHTGDEGLSSRAETDDDDDVCLAVCSMAGPLGGLELVHYLLLPGGGKSVTGELLF